MEAKKKRSAPSSRCAKRKPAGQAQGDDLIAGLKLAIRHARGEIELPGHRLIAVAR